MVVDGKTLPGSNISVLVNDIIRKAKHEVDPVGRIIGNVNLLLRVNLRLKYRGSNGKMTDRYYNPGQPGSFGGLPITERYLKGNV